MLQKLMRMLGVTCRHRHLSHPFAAVATARSTSDGWETVGAGGGHYVVCLDCGRKFRYDWSAMRVIW